ncbi:MAG TPA: hypothetical protein VHN18_09935, partial [Micromonosporaceae bacterium]|nr:hypothetical protein [Micromonosporaceae bacterium]
MATRSGSRRGSGSTATKNQPGNQTPNTPDINESEIAALKVDQLRDRLRRRGITGTTDMHKDELVKTLIKAMREGRKTTGRTEAATPGRAESTAQEADTGPKRESNGQARAAEPRSELGVPEDIRAPLAPLPRPPANTPEHVVPSQPRVAGSPDAGGAGSGRSLMVDETDKVIASMLPPELGPVDEVVTPEGTVIVPESASAPGGGRSVPAQRGGAPADDLADSRTAGTPADRRTAGTPADSGGGIRIGDHASKSLKYSQEISSVDEEPERAGRSLVTTNHDVIRRWAQERNGVPATVDGTEHDGRAGVLRIDFP